MTARSGLRVTFGGVQATLLCGIVTPWRQAPCANLAFMADRKSMQAR